MKNLFDFLRLDLIMAHREGFEPRSPDSKSALYPVELPVRYLRTNFSFEYKQEIFINNKIKVLIN